MITSETHLQYRIVGSAQLTPADLTNMLRLMQACFTDVDVRRFHADLHAKPWVILLLDTGGVIQGFSTLDIMRAQVAGREVHAVYSGDTVIDAGHRSTSALPRAFLRFVARHTGANRVDDDWYWFYVCKGFRTYRFLPVFYQKFHPHPNVDTPVFEQQVMDALAVRRFGGDYDPATGVVRVAGDYALRRGVGDVTPERSRDPFVRYFASRNPGWAEGDELVCLVSLERMNLRPKARQWLDQEQAP